MKRIKADNNRAQSDTILAEVAACGVTAHIVRTLHMYCSTSGRLPGRCPTRVRDANDVVGDAHMTLAGAEGSDDTWTDDRFCLPGHALALAGTGQGFASTTGAVLTTEESFSVNAWAGLPSLTGHPQTVLSQAGRVQPAMSLQATPDGRWRFTVPTRNPYDDLGVAETEPGAVRVGVWNHLAGVLDLLSGEVRLYVNGELAADGPFYLGVAGTTRNITSEPLDGVVDSVDVWTSTLDPDRIRDMAVGNGVPIDGC